MTGQLVRSVSSRLARNPVSKTKMEVGEEDIHISFCPHIHTCAHKHMHTPHTQIQNVRIKKGVGCVQGARRGGHSGKGAAEDEVEFAPAGFQGGMILGPHLCSQAHCGRAGMGRHA